MRHRSETIASTANPLVKRLKSLMHKKYRRAEGLFLAEGLRLATDAVDAGWTPAIVLAQAGAGHRLLARLKAATLDGGGIWAEATAAVLSAVTGKENAQPLVAAFPVRHLTLGHQAPGSAARWLAADRLRDPGNLGTLVRACDGAGAGGLVLMGDCADWTSPEAVRASMGAVFTVPLLRAAAHELIAWARDGNAHMVGAALDPRSIDYRRIAYPLPTVVVVGNEQQGLDPVLAQACDSLAIIPMAGRADSLNVAMAGTLMLYEALRHQEDLAEQPRAR